VIRVPIAAFLLLAALTQPLTSQAVRGRLASPGGGAVTGALVVLVPQSGAAQRATVSDGSGSFSIETGDTGSFALRIERPGFAAFQSAAFRLGPGAPQDLVMEVQSARLSLEGVRAASAQCVAGAGQGAPAELWEHAVKALRIIALAEEAGVLDVKGVRYIRLLDNSGTIQQGVIDQEPFAGVVMPYPTPPDQLLPATGFAGKDATGALVYHVPSPAILSSDAFLAGHCLYRVIAPRDQPQQVGLGFRPLPRTSAVGIEGILWLDRSTALPQSIEYEYRDPSGTLARGARGLFGFHRGPDGILQVSRWWLRMPRVFETVFRGGGAERNRNVVESGAMALDADDRPLEDPDGVYALLSALFRFDPIEVQAKRALAVMSEGAMARIGAEELLGAPPTDAGAIVSLLRPGWLARAQGWKLSEEGGGGDCVVYLDRMRWSRELAPDSAGTSSCRAALSDIPASWVASIEFVPPIEAAAIYGLGHGYGVIVVRSRRQ